jgi:prepilin-type N-terminal cleavage/methylation domain-containing protein
MWRSSSNPRAAGFTLMEVLVVLACLGMILWMAGQLLFPMRAAAERQRLQVEARQTARSAADYSAYVIRGATDLNDRSTPFNPASVLTYLWRGANPGAGGANFPACPGDGSCVQLAYNNVDQGATSFASNGTDILTLTAAQVTTPVLLESASAWPNPFNDASVQYWAYNLGCPDDAANLLLFKTLTQDPATPTQSLPLLLVDPGSGAWLTYRITNYRDGNNATSCTALNPTCIVGGVNVPCIEVNASPQDATSLNPPGGLEVIANPPNLIVGSRFTTLRVCNGWLEQKNETFDPAADANCGALPGGTVEFPDYVVKAGWSPLLPNVEDFQISYSYRNGETWNRPGATLSATQGCNNGVPSLDANPGTVNPFDARSVIGIRVTITARSSTPVRLGGKMEFRQPAAEDHDPTTAPNDTYYRYQVSALAMLRNRTTLY